MSNTPRTDEIEARYDAGQHGAAGIIVFARELERENTALWENRARLWDECALWHEAYCRVGDALGVKEPELAGGHIFAELVKELLAKNAALRERIEILSKSTKQTDEYICVDREHGLWKRKEAQP